MTQMLVSDFDYGFPAELIAQQPLPKRDQSRMMVVFRQEGKIVHSQFKELPDFLEAGDVLVLNETKVIPAKAWGKKKGKEIEFLFLGERGKSRWEVLCRPARKANVGDKIAFAPDFEGEVVEAGKEGRRILKFAKPDVLAALKKIGFAPLPPYIKRGKDKVDLRSSDLESYQTVFARKEGAVAAPTAGLHFTPEVLEEIQKKGVSVKRIVLEVGLATFQPVREERVEDHKMLKERYIISPAAARTINQAKKEGRPVMAVGTTVVRALESAFRNGSLLSGKRSTGLFIYPGHEFKVVNKLLTNFHLPKSTLLMLVAAFGGIDLIKKAYVQAVGQKYRFYSYGDCMLIL